MEMAPDTSFPRTKLWSWRRVWARPGMQVHLLPGNRGDAIPEHHHVFGVQEEAYLLSA